MVKKKIAKGTRTGSTTMKHRSEWSLNAGIHVSHLQNKGFIYLQTFNPHFGRTK